MASSATLDRGLAAFAEYRWTDAFTALTEADGEGVLQGADLERLSTAALLLGREDLGVNLTAGEVSPVTSGIVYCRRTCAPPNRATRRCRDWRCSDWRRATRDSRAP